MNEFPVEFPELTVIEWFLIVVGHMKNGRIYVNIVEGFPSEKEARKAAKRFRNRKDFKFLKERNKLSLHVRPLYQSKVLK